MEDLRTGYYERRKDESLEEKFVLYKLQNIIAVVAVVLLIVMDIFHIHVGGIGTDEIYTEISRSFTMQEIFQQLTQLPQHLFSSPAP